MTALRLCAWPCLFLVILLPGPLSADAQPAARDVTWDDLLPEGWVPPAADINHFFDAAPAQSAVSHAPVVASLDGQRIRLPGYLVPIEIEGENLRTFLMVPYFGACIHVPPPPPNQIVYVEMPAAITLDDPYGAHWVTGVISAQESSTSLAQTAYTMKGERVEVFDWDAFYEKPRE